jgi:hypothetical protein
MEVNEGKTGHITCNKRHLKQAQNRLVETRTKYSKQKNKTRANKRTKMEQTKEPKWSKQGVGTRHQPELRRAHHHRFLRPTPRPQSHHPVARRHSNNPIVLRVNKPGGALKAM